MSTIEIFLIALSVLGLCFCIFLYVYGKSFEKRRKQEREEQHWLEKDMKL